MRSNPFRMVLWQYPEDVTVERLHRHHRVASRIQAVCLGSSVLMASTIVQLLLSSEGWLRTISLIVLMVSCGVAMLTMVPALLSGLWANDIEKILSARGLPLPDAGRARERLPRMAMRMCYWFIVIILIATFIDRL